jgi:hypothetical protein
MNSCSNRSNANPNSESIATSVKEWHPRSFIVKIWLEETLEETGKVCWRGHITDVQSGERRYLKDLSDIGIFILDSMKIHSGFRWLIWKWLFGPSN